MCLLIILLYLLPPKIWRGGAGNVRSPVRISGMLISVEECMFSLFLISESCFYILLG